MTTEQLARPASQPQHVDGLIDGGRCGFLDILDLAHKPILLPEPSSRMLVEKLLGDAPVELVHVHRLDARLDLLVPGLQLLDGVWTGRLLAGCKPRGVSRSLPLSDPHQQHDRTKHDGKIE
jgi:hypothetical protein